MQTVLDLDYEVFSYADVVKCGLDRHSAHPQTRALMAAYSFDHGSAKQWISTDGPFPRELREALEDPEVEKWGFNSQYERTITRRVLKIDTPIRNWRCVQALAYMQSFWGNLGDVGGQMMIAEDKVKGDDGKRLVKMFTGPQRTTKNQPHVIRDASTDPEEWQRFVDYNRQDLVAEIAIKRPLLRYPIPDFEWEVYEIDQAINDAGLPIDRRFVEAAIRMANRRKAELFQQMQEKTGLANPNSVQQLLGWVRERGYPFMDLGKDTVKKVLANDELEYFIEDECAEVLKLRQQAARSSVKKYDKILELVGEGDRLRYQLQFAGASRTNRWAARGINTQNLTKTPKEIEEIEKLTITTDIIREEDYEMLGLWVSEPMNALAGTVRSAIAVDEEDDEELVVSDLASIESVVIGYISGCERLLEVFRSGKDAYKDFGQTLYSKPYDDVTRGERNNSKPAVLGAGFRLGGGELFEGKRTGLWGYAENMGVNLTQEEAHRAVKVFRETYPEIPQLWYALEDAAVRAVRTKKPVIPIIRFGSKRIEVPVVFEMMSPYLTIKLPSGRRIFYYKPQVHQHTFRGRPTEEYPDGKPYTKLVVSYLGKAKEGKKQVRIYSHGGLMTENIVQAIARDILAYGMVRAWRIGFPIVGHVHDELIALVRRLHNYLNLDRLRRCMSMPIPWLPDAPLGAAGWVGRFYRKD